MSTASANDGGKTKGRGANQRDVVRFNLYLPREAYEQLEQLQNLSGKRSLAETIRAALKLYQVVQEGIVEGKDVLLVDRKNQEKERLVQL